MAHRSNYIVSAIARIMSCNVMSTTGANLRRIWLETDVNPFINNVTCVLNNIKYHKLPAEEAYKIVSIKELTDFKFDLCDSNLSLEEINFMLKDLYCL